MKGPPDIAQLCLGHKTGVEVKKDHSSRTVVTHWALYPLNGVSRPDSGTRNVTVVCSECRKSIRLTVDSESVAKTKPPA